MEEAPTNLYKIGRYKMQSVCIIRGVYCPNVYSKQLFGIFALWTLKVVNYVPYYDIGLFANIPI